MALTKEMKAFVSLTMSVPVEMRLEGTDEGVGFQLRQPDPTLVPLFYSPDGVGDLNMEVIDIARDHIILNALKAALRIVEERIAKQGSVEVVSHFDPTVKGYLQ